MDASFFLDLRILLSTMVNTCVVWGCKNRSNGADTHLKFFDIPKVISHQGIQTKDLSNERRRLWLARINRAGFNPDPSKRHFKVCSEHFLNGTNNMNAFFG